jgi:hypothetical protein
VPASVTVAANAITATFPATTVAVGAQATSTISATYNAVQQTAVLTVNPPVISSVTLNPTSLIGGATSTATVTLNATAPTGGVALTVSSDNTSAATLSGSTVMVPGGQHFNDVHGDQHSGSCDGNRQHLSNVDRRRDPGRCSDRESADALEPDPQPHDRGFSGSVNRDCHDYGGSASSGFCSQSLQQRHHRRDGPGHNHYCSRANFRQLYSDDSAPLTAPWHHHYFGKPDWLADTDSPRLARRHRQPVWR